MSSPSLDRTIFRAPSYALASTSPYIYVDTHAADRQTVTSSQQQKHNWVYTRKYIGRTLAHWWLLLLPGGCVILCCILYLTYSYIRRVQYWHIITARILISMYNAESGIENDNRLYYVDRVSQLFIFSASEFQLIKPNIAVYVFE